MECVFDSTEMCSIGATSGSFFGSSLIRTFFGLYLVAICVALWKRFRVDTVTQAGIFCALALLAVPESGFYTLVLTGSVLAIGIRKFQGQDVELKYAHIWLINCLVVSGAPIAFAGLRGTDVALFDVLRFHNVVVPLSWGIYLSFLFLRPHRADSSFLK